MEVFKRVRGSVPGSDVTSPTSHWLVHTLEDRDGASSFRLPCWRSSLSFRSCLRSLPSSLAPTDIWGRLCSLLCFLCFSNKESLKIGEFKSSESFFPSMFIFVGMFQNLLWLYWNQGFFLLLLKNNWQNFAAFCVWKDVSLRPNVLGLVSALWQGENNKKGN